MHGSTDDAREGASSRAKLLLYVEGDGPVPAFLFGLHLPLVQFFDICKELREDKGPECQGSRRRLAPIFIAFQNTLLKK